MPNTNSAARLAALRAELAAQGLDGFVMPISDEHMSEYVGAYAQRLEWLTGFGGSAGTAVVLADQAAIFVDGRYTLQVRDQVDGALYEYQNVPATSPAAWLGKHARKARASAMTHGCTPAPGRAPPRRWPPRAPRWCPWSATHRRGVDRSPAALAGPAVPHPLALAGVPSEAKRAALAEGLAAQGADAAVISALDRWPGCSISGAGCGAHAGCPVFPHRPCRWHRRSVHRARKGDAHAERASGQRRAHRPARCFRARAGRAGGKRWWWTRNARWTRSSALEAAGAQILEQRDPTVLPKAVKNPVEQAGHRAAQARDGAAMVRFLHWLSGKAPRAPSPK
jgi:Xaa-Pro aminopeptidase